jgi:hypothetical protein
MKNSTQRPRWFRKGGNVEIGVLPQDFCKSHQEFFPSFIHLRAVGMPPRSVIVVSVVGDIDRRTRVFSLSKSIGPIC